MKAQGAPLVGSVVGGVLTSACCIGPLVFALLGISGAAFAHRFEPFRPYFLVTTEGVTAYDVSLEKGEAGVNYDTAKTTPDKIAESVSRTGFAASVKGSREKREK